MVVPAVVAHPRRTGNDVMRAGTERPPTTRDTGPASPGGGTGRSRRSRPGAERLEALRDRLVASRLTPNQISMTGFVLNVIAAVLVWQHEFFIGGVVFIVGSICDTLDGGYSRMSGKGTPFGAFLDSTLDRIVEGIVLTAVAVTFTQREDELAVAAVVVAVMASLVVSYTRARAEALGVECKVGIADRLVRVIILSAGLVFAAVGALEPAVYVLAALSSFTVVQRILHVRRQLAQPPSV
jgi:CDP-diacylglycerol--glycerol-3-phosphate 3-phosphatidyltransferase